jgi:putative lipoic acid-binding regulatory protein
MTMVEDSLQSFPCDIPIKIFGRSETGLRETALDIVRSHCGSVTDDQVVERLSRNGSYVSLTITVRFETRAQADAVYRELSSHDQVLMVL